MSQTKPVLNLIPRKAKLESSKEHIVEVLLRITTPQFNLDNIQRPPLNLCVVLDRSGSMAGTKMKEAIEATKMCIDRMEERDNIGFVIFDSVVETVFPNRPVNDKALLKEQVEQIFARGNTALHAAWVAGGLEVNKKQDPAAINRILLITDGQANVGESSPAVISHQARELNSRGVSTTTIGIGTDFNESLLIPMAEAGGGNAWHVETPESMSRIFDVELNGLVNQFGHTVSLSVTPIPGVEVTDILNDFEKQIDGRHKLPNLTAANNLDIVMRLRISSLAACDTKDLAAFDVTFIGQQSGIPERAEGKVSLSFVSAEEAAAVKDDAEVEAAVLLLSNARDRRSAMESLDRGDSRNAREILDRVRSNSSLVMAHNASPAVSQEFRRLNSEISDLDSHDEVMARKKMAFARNMRVHGKFGLIFDREEQ